MANSINMLPNEDTGVRNVNPNNSEKNVFFEGNNLLRIINNCSQYISTKLSFELGVMMQIVCDIYCSLRFILLRIFMMMFAKRNLCKLNSALLYLIFAMSGYKAIHSRYKLYIINPRKNGFGVITR